MTIAVVGAGPAGLAAAWWAARAGHEVVVLERAPHVGGMAASRTVAGLRVDHGSHRLHPSTEPGLLAELGTLLGDDLQVRPRHGRLKVAGRWVGFPLHAVDLVQSLPPGLAARAAGDALGAPLRRWRSAAAPPSFGAALRAGLGPALVDAFYAPYARKLWDARPEDLDADLARRRVSAGGPAALARRVLRGARPEGRTFLYPRRGFGQIVEALADAAVAAGAELRTGAAVTGLEPAGDGGAVVVRTAGEPAVEAAAVLSTAPVTRLASWLGGEEVALRHRAMVVAWVVLDAPRYTEFDAHYLPDPAHPVSRVSEPRNYRTSVDDPAGVTVLCAELPCWEGDALWASSASEVGEVVADALAREGLPPCRPVAVEVARLPAVYPVHRPGFAWAQARAEAWVQQAGAGRVVTLGRQGLFVPDNTHHALAMGRAAAASLRADGTPDAARWAEARAAFHAHVVED